MRDTGVSSGRAGSSNERCLLLYTKPARPGRVKTRLIGAALKEGRRNLSPQGISAEQAAQLHAAFLGDLSERLVAGRFRLRVAWALAAGEESFPADLVTGADDHVRQEGSDLGARLFHGLAAAAGRFPAAAAGRFPVIAAVGSDHPELALETVEEAFERLESGADAVFGPAEDGGYYLVALRAAAVRRELFAGVDWSTGEVLAQSLARCRRLGLETSLLKGGHDVDVARDLRRLAARLQASSDLCPRTRALLADWGWLYEEVRR